MTTGKSDSNGGKRRATTIQHRAAALGHHRLYTGSKQPVNITMYVTYPIKNFQQKIHTTAIRNKSH